MELKEFISQALADIVQGVSEAQVRLDDTHSQHINPKPLQILPSAAPAAASGQPMHRVEFDIAVTAIESSGTKGGIGVVAGAFGLGAQGQTAIENSAVSRIKFSIPVTLPYGYEAPGRR